DFLCARRQRAPADRRRPRAVGPPPFGHFVGIALDDLDIVVGNPEFVGDALGVGGPVALSVARGTTASSHFPTGMDTNYPICPETGLCGELGRQPRRCEATRLDVTRQADAEVSSLLTASFLSFAEVVVAPHLKRAVEGRFVVAAVV